MSEWMKELERLAHAYADKKLARYGLLHSAETSLKHDPDAACAALLAHAAQRDVQPEPSGWRLVPVEPTDAMLGAGLKHIDGMASMPGAYRAMLDAAPHPVEAPQSVELPEPTPILTAEQALEAVAEMVAYGDAREAAGYARGRDRMRVLIADIKAWDVSQYLTIPHDLRGRMSDALAEAPHE